MRVAARLDPYHHRPLQSLVKFPCFLGMQQPAFHQLARFLVQHCHLLEARMKVTTDILHMRPPSSRAPRSLVHRVYSGLFGGRCSSSNQAPPERAPGAPSKPDFGLLGWWSEGPQGALRAERESSDLY